MAKGKRTQSSAYVERDVSWMYFNHRILQEAEKEDIPLLERLSFLGIYSNNLDEFFRVRVASLSHIADDKSLGKQNRTEIRQTIKKINRLNEQYSEEYNDAVERVFAELERHKVRLLKETQLNDEQRAFLTRLFYERMNGSMIPIWVSEIDDISALEDNRIYLMVEKTAVGEGSPSRRYAIVKVPDRAYGRWIKIPSSEGYDNIMYLDDVVRFFMPLIFVGLKESTFRAFSFKFTKDAEMEMDNYSDFGVMEKIAMGVNSRKRGDTVRVIYDREMPPEMRRKLHVRLNTEELDTTLAGGRYQNHKDLMNFPDCGHGDLKYPRWQNIMKPEFVASASILDAIRQRDRFIHVPYHSFDCYTRVLREAAIKPEVRAIKTTLYRVARDSKVVKALIAAARNGKKVTVVVELLARFDEESNIKWSKRMQEEGVNVIFGVEGLKVHSKLLFIESRKGNIACVGTGNFHEGNAKIYTDYIMMTARRGIVAEVAKVFDFINRPFAALRFRELLVSPNSMKLRIIHLVDAEIAAARSGEEAWIKIKINHITDPDMVRKLYEASAAGVKIEIAVRGNCSLVTGIPGVSETIRCVGIIDRYLEHSRILIFASGGKPKYFLGSADWMPRNLTGRIEVMTPVYDKLLQDDLMRTVCYALRDTRNARIVDGSGANVIQPAASGCPPFRSQEELYNAYLKG